SISPIISGARWANITFRVSAALENILALIAGLIRRARVLKSLASTSRESHEIPGELLAAVSTLLRPHPAAASMTSRTQLHVARHTRAASETCHDGRGDP